MSLDDGRVRTELATGLAHDAPRRPAQRYSPLAGPLAKRPVIQSSGRFDILLAPPLGRHPRALWTSALGTPCTRQMHYYPIELKNHSLPS